MLENQQVDKKSLRFLTKPKPDWDELAKDCVAFANAHGGRILIGVEDRADAPPAGQKISSELPEKVQRSIQQKTINVSVIPSIRTAENGGEYLEILIQRSASSVAGTSDGRYYLRVSDECKPVYPDELLRLLNDRAAFTWETHPALKVSRSETDSTKLNQFVRDVRASGRVSAFVKEKSKPELLDHYLFTAGDYLTNLGILWVGKREHRARLHFAPSLQFIKYDEAGEKTDKYVWDEYSLNPKEIIQAIWEQVPYWKESTEISDGIFRKTIAHYDEAVVRELLANALVHRPYTTRGDVFINLYPDRLEIHNPGLLPLGVTPKNILHKSVQRNPHLAKVFYDLHLMEKEGSGYDAIYDRLLLAGKPLPEPREGDDRVSVTIQRRIVNPEVVRFLDAANQHFQLRTKERISLGLVAQHTNLTALEFSRLLSLEEPNAIRTWMGRLPDLKLINSKGRTRGTTYFVEPTLLKKLDFTGQTTLKGIAPHRLRELIREDLAIYGPCRRSQIHQRIGKEIRERTIREAIADLVKKGVLQKTGTRASTQYVLADSTDEKVRNKYPLN